MSSDKHKKNLRRLSKLLLAISVLLCIALFLAYTIQPDFCAAVTFWPVWIWAIAGIILSLVATGTNKKSRLAAMFIWLLLVGLTAEEPLALLQSFTRSNRDCKSYCPGGNCLRVISLNCAGGNIIATEDLFKYSPDIVLLQESPGVKDLDTLTQKLFGGKGEFVLQGDTAILANGRVIKTEVSKEDRLFMTGARVSLPSGLEIETLSIRLSPPATGTNLLSPDCWREHREDRRERLRQIGAIEEYLAPIDQNVPLIIGGDFNANPWRGAANALSPRLYDTFKKGGFGWPGTGPSHLPLWRVDQIWASRHFKTIKVRSETCKNSDHRIVICDLCRL